MTSLPFSSLTDKQLVQVAYLFADSFFGTDASAFVYEVDGGEVIGRWTMDGGRCTETHIHPKVNVTVSQEVNVTEEMRKQVNMNMDALSALVAQNIYQHQFEEVQLCN
jgi:hypothetical protein